MPGDEVMLCAKGCDHQSGGAQCGMAAKTRCVGWREPAKVPSGFSPEGLGQLDQRPLCYVVAYSAYVGLGLESVFQRCSLTMRTSARPIGCHRLCTMHCPLAQRHRKHDLLPDLTERIFSMEKTPFFKSRFFRPQIFRPQIFRPMDFAEQSNVAFQCIGAGT